MAFCQPRIFLQDLRGFERAFQARAEPDMVQTPAAVRGFPVGGAIAPPGINFLVRRNEVAGESVQSNAACASPSNRVSTGVWLTIVEQLLVRPDVMLQRRDIEIAHQHDGIAVLRFCVLANQFSHLVQEVELVGELDVELGIGNVAAGGDIEIVQLHAIRQGHAHVAGMAFAAEILHAGLAEGQAREHRHARDRPSGRG